MAFNDTTTQLRTAGAPAPTVIQVHDELQVHNKAVPFKLPPNPPTYTHGGDTMPFLFLAELQNWLVFNAVPVENWALVMAQCLRGPAATWFNLTLTTWTEKKQKPVCRTVKEAFLRRFVGQNWQTQMRTCLTKLKYANSVEDFVTKVQMLNLYLDDRTDADRIHHFVERLPHTVQRHVRQQHPTTFQEHLDAALTFETPAELSVEQLLLPLVSGSLASVYVASRPGTRARGEPGRFLEPHST